MTIKEKELEMQIARFNHSLGFLLGALNNEGIQDYLCESGITEVMHVALEMALKKFSKQLIDRERSEV